MFAMVNVYIAYVDNFEFLFESLNFKSLNIDCI